MDCGIKNDIGSRHALIELGSYSLGPYSLQPPDLDLEMNSLSWDPTVWDPTAGILQSEPPDSDLDMQMPVLKKQYRGPYNLKVV